MIEDPPLLKVKKTRRRPTAAQINAFQNIPTAQIVDARGGRGALNMGVSQQTILPASGVSIAGPALTAENASADVLASFAAIHYAEAGDILVAGFSGNQSCAGAGDRLCGMLINVGAVEINKLMKSRNFKSHLVTLSLVIIGAANAPSPKTNMLLARFDPSTFPLAMPGLS